MTFTIHRTALVVSFLLASCAQAASCMADVQAQGLQVITSPDYPPYESLDKDNKMVGFDIDLVNLIAKKMKVNVHITASGYDSLIPALLAKKAQMSAAGLTITDERKKSVDFSLPYIAGPNAIVTNKADNSIHKLGDLAGKTVAVQLGTTQEKLVSGVAGANVKSYNLYTDAALAVQTHQAQALVLHKVVAQSFIKVYPDLKIAATLGSINTGFAVRKDCADLTNRLNATLIGLRKSGEMQALVNKWFK